MIDFWFTTGSTYTYLTVFRIPEIEKIYGVRFNWRPFARGRAANVEGAPFVEGSSKIAYMWHDIERRAAKYGIPVRVPAPYPSIDTKLRDCVALLGIREGWGQSFVRENYTRWLVRLRHKFQKPSNSTVFESMEGRLFLPVNAASAGLHLVCDAVGLEHGNERDGVVDIAVSLEQIGQDAERIIQKARSPELLALYDDETNQARDLGIFGSPTFAVGREIFWGDDHLEDAVSWYQNGRLA